MTSNETTRAAVQAIDAMTEDEVANWVGAGDYTSIGGVNLPANVSQRVAEFMAGAEVEGFACESPAVPLGIPVPYPNLGITHRKAGGHQHEYFKVTMKDILITS
jgi:hypothetical protein